jgi:hypothetical protein
MKKSGRNKSARRIDRFQEGPARLGLRRLAAVRVASVARPVPLGFVLRRRLDFLPRVVDVDVFVLVPPFLRPAAALLA